MIKDKLSRTGINARINKIRRVFKWGVSREMVPPTILQGLQAVSSLKYGRTSAPDTEPVRPVLDEYVDAVLPHVNRQVAALMQLQRLTGMRFKEVTMICFTPSETFCGCG